MTTTTTTKKEFKKERFEFLFKINGNIICQRYFPIIGYSGDEAEYLKDFTPNPNHLFKSKELFLLTDSIRNKFIKHMTKKSVDYLWSTYNPYKEQTQEELDTKRVRREEKSLKKDFYTFEIKVDNKVISESIIPADAFPPGDKFNPGPRYNVDIKELIPLIMAEIRNCFTRKKYSSEYVDNNFDRYLI